MENLTPKPVVIRCFYSVKKADNPDNICFGCALRIGLFVCLNREACPDDGTGLNLSFQNSDVEQ